MAEDFCIRSAADDSLCKLILTSWVFSVEKIYLYLNQLSWAVGSELKIVEIKLNINL